MVQEGCAHYGSFEIYTSNVRLISPVGTNGKEDSLVTIVFKIIKSTIGSNGGVGLNLYATKGAAEADVSLEDIIRAIFPFFFAMLACLVILYLFPPLSTFLPNLIF